jgi:hypothetical protein
MNSGKSTLLNKDLPYDGQSKGTDIKGYYEIYSRYPCAFAFFTGNGKKFES